MTTDNTPDKSLRHMENALRRRAQHAICVGEHVIEMRSILEALNSTLIRGLEEYTVDEKAAHICWVDCYEALDAITDVLIRITRLISVNYPDSKEEIMTLQLFNHYACKRHQVSTLTLPDLPEEYQEPKTTESPEPTSDKDESSN